MAEGLARYPGGGLGPWGHRSDDRPGGARGVTRPGTRRGGRPGLSGVRSAPCWSARPGAPRRRRPGPRRMAARGGRAPPRGGSSFLGQVLARVERAVQAGLSVVSTCEELAYPWLAPRGGGGRLDALCEKPNVAVVGHGREPRLRARPAARLLSQVTGPVRHLRGLRVQDLARRRESLQRKVGAGLSEEQFHDAAESGELGHVGLAESAMLAALGCGFELDEVEEELVPLIAEEDLDRPPVRAGQVAGLRQLARGFADGAERVRLELVIAAGVENPRDEVELDARPPLALGRGWDSRGRRHRLVRRPRRPAPSPCCAGSSPCSTCPRGARETMLDKSLIGRESEPLVLEVERGAIRRFAEAIGDATPSTWTRRRPARPVRRARGPAHLPGGALAERALPPLARPGYPLAAARRAGHSSTGGPSWRATASR